MTATFNAHEYVLACGWDFSAIQATAENGLSETDIESIGQLTGGESEDACNALLSWCKAKVEARELTAYQWAKNEQGYEGTFAEWMALPADERSEYELGAAGIPTG